MKIKIYSTPTCPYCIAAKKFFKERNIEFEDINVSLSQEKAQEMIELSGQMGVPVIMIDGQMIIGFDQQKIEKIIAK